MTDQQVIDALLRSVDPVPNPADPPSGTVSAEAALLEIERRSQSMQTHTESTQQVTPPPSGPRWRPLWAAAAAFVAVIIIGVVIALLPGGDEVDVATTVTTTAAPPTTTTAAPVAPEIDLVMQSIAAWNAGDFDVWRGFFADPAVDEQLFSRSVMYSNEQIEVTSPCEIVSEAEGAVRVVCEVLVEDDFHGAGGITSDGTMTFEVAESGLILDTSSTTYQDDDGECCPRWQDFHTAFFTWLAAAHPDVYDEIGPVSPANRWQLPGYARGDAEHMRIALAYVDEFVAQSDVYPVEDGVV